MYKAGQAEAPPRDVAAYSPGLLTLLSPIASTLAQAGPSTLLPQPTVCLCCGGPLPATGSPGVLESRVKDGAGGSLSSAPSKSPPTQHAWGNSAERGVCGSGSQSPVAVVVELVVAAQGCQAPDTDGKGEEDLGARVHPHLHREKEGKLLRRTPGFHGSTQAIAKPGSVRFGMARTLPSACAAPLPPCHPRGRYSRDP